MCKGGTNSYGRVQCGVRLVLDAEPSRHRVLLNPSCIIPTYTTLAGLVTRRVSYLLHSMQRIQVTIIHTLQKPRSLELVFAERPQFPLPFVLRELGRLCLDVVCRRVILRERAYCAQSPKSDNQGGMKRRDKEIRKQPSGDPTSG